MKATWVTKKEFNQAVKGIECRFSQLDQKIDDRQSELVAMIKTGFDDLSSQFRSHSRILSDHEKRLAVVE